mgnify:CR=1 FL=1
MSYVEKVNAFITSEFHHLVGVLFILQHQLHQVKLAVHETPAAHRRIHVRDIAGPSVRRSTHSAQGILQVIEIVGDVGAWHFGRRVVAVLLRLLLLLHSS